jgi:hypothetical protein
MGRAPVEHENPSGRTLISSQCEKLELDIPQVIQTHAGSISHQGPGEQFTIGRFFGLKRFGPERREKRFVAFDSLEHVALIETQRNRKT